MTVAAGTANDPAGPAMPVDMRDGAAVRAGSYVYDGPDLVTNWHHHDLHQLEYSWRGVAEVETGSARYLLPPQQAMWLPAGAVHRTTLCGVRSVSVFFAPDLLPAVGPGAKVLAVGPLLRELMHHSRRWPIGRDGRDARADTFFAALADVVAEALEHEAPLVLPTSDHPVVGAAIACTGAHLATATVESVAGAVGVSPRSLRRIFVAETGITWQQYRNQARLLRAMALLAEPGRSVLDVALAVGFEDPGALARAFRRFTGETPTAYRHRVAGSGDPGVP